MANGELLAEIDAGPLENDRTSVFWHIEQSLHKTPHKAAVICMHQRVGHLSYLVPVASNNANDCLTLTYTQLHRGALTLAAGMLANGVQPGSSVLMLIPNGGEYSVLLWACVLMRLTFTSLDQSALDESKHAELRDLMLELKPGAVVVANVNGGRAMDNAIEAGCLEQPLRISLDISGTSGAWKSLLDLVTDASHSPTDETTLLENARKNDPDRIHSILFTSGTSAGRPKGCPQRVAAMTHVLHHLSWLINSSNCARVLQQADSSRAIAPAHTLQTWKEGGAVVTASASFAIDDTLEAILRHGVTFIVLSPAMVHALADKLATHPGKRDSVRTIHLGGDAVTKDVLTKCAALFPTARVCISHGMTEGLGFFQWPFLDTPISQIPVFGEVCPTGVVSAGTRLRIWDADSKALSERGKPGELHARCESIIRHYLGGSGESSFYEDEEGRWFITGDIATMDDNGLVFILGRTKDVIKRAGITIMPAVLESCIEKYTDTQTSVVAIPHPTVGHEPFAVLDDFNNGKNEDEIQNHVLHTFGSEYALGGVLSLQQIGFQKFPVNATHKVMKFEVQKAVMEHLKREAK